jgi:hypothetical protein
MLAESFDKVTSKLRHIHNASLTSTQADNCERQCRRPALAGSALLAATAAAAAAAAAHVTVAAAAARCSKVRVGKPTLERRALKQERAGGASRGCLEGGRAIPHFPPPTAPALQHGGWAGNGALGWRAGRDGPAGHRGSGGQALEGLRACIWKVGHVNPPCSIL